MKKNIRSQSLADLEAFFILYNEKPFRAKQVHEWLWLKAARTFDAMTNLPLNVRRMLEAEFYINSIRIHNVQKSNDRTIKVAFMLTDGRQVEGVLIPDKKRVTACISSQVGCALKCGFCATGQLGFVRNLDHDEIFDQVVLLRNLSIENFSVPLTNIVYMGMGEPLMNYDNVIRSIEKLTSDKALAMSPRRITVSTVGIADKIRLLADDKVKFNLAISLHSADDAIRTSIAPVNKKYPLKELSSALKYFYEKTGTRITYEYLLLREINDSITDARLLGHFCKITPCKINLIEYNDNSITGFRRADPARVRVFADFLKGLNMVVSIRKSRGKDIKAACGQLANNF